MLDLKDLETQITTLSCVIFLVFVTITVIHIYRGINNNTMVSQIDTTRVNEGLPTDITLTPEDFAADPELAEIFGITDTNTNLDLNLESNEHFEEVQNQIATINRDNIMNALNDLNNEDYFMSLFDEYTARFVDLMNYDILVIIYEIIIEFIIYVF
jgi:hypothetical protein